jgi:hypothetical protein
MDDTQIALKTAEALVKAEQAMQPHQEEIDVFMAGGASMSIEAEEAFEDWAMQLNLTCKAFRKASIFYHREWSAQDYVQAAQLRIPASF